jgi:DNA-binding NarL/FixJ family response regulator
VISVFIVSEVRLYREGLAVVLGCREGVRVVGCGAPQNGVCAQIAAAGPDVVLFDMPTSENTSFLRQLTSANGIPRVVSLGVGDRDCNVIACVELGVSGLAGRDASLDELMDTLQCAMRGELLCTPRAAAAMARRVAVAGTTAVSETLTKSRLSARELQIVRFIDDGLSNKEIATHLGIELPTVKNHIHHLLSKLQVRRRGEAAAQIRRCGAMSPTDDRAG